MKVAEKVFVGQKPLRVALFRKDEDLIYSMIYRDGKDGAILAKRFTVGGITRDKDYDLTKGRPGTRVLYFAVHKTNEESSAQMLLVHLKPALRMRNLIRPLHFAEFGIKGRSSGGQSGDQTWHRKIVRAPKDYDPLLGALEDYRDFLRSCNQPEWDKDSKEVRFVRKLGSSQELSYELFRDFIETRPGDVVANIVISLIHQTNYLLDQQIRRLEKDFLKEGGLRERMTRARLDARGKQKRGE
jgi:four helix bundle suffix protein